MRIRVVKASSCPCNFKTIPSINCCKILMILRAVKIACPRHLCQPCGQLKTNIYGRTRGQPGFTYLWNLDIGIYFIVSWLVVKTHHMHSGLQLPFAIVANLEKNIELATMALQLAKTLAPWFFSSIHSHFHIIVVATIVLCSPDICVYPPSPVIFLQTTKSTVLPPPLPIETTFQWVGAEF